LTEAKAAAAARWNQLLEMEQQVQHERRNLADRPKSRPAEP
jgi:hypothetical protein